MLAVRVSGVGIVAALLAISIKKTNPELALQVSIAAGIIILLLVSEELAKAVDFVKTMIDRMGEAYTGVSIMLKVVGIAYLSEFSAASLRDAGESAIAAKIELAGKIIIIVLTLPLFEEFITMVLSLAEGI